MSDDIVKQLRFGCPFKPGLIGEKDSEKAELVMLNAANEIEKLRDALNKLARNSELKNTLERARLAISDAVMLHAPEFCDKENVDKARTRILDGGGTLAYFAETIGAIKEQEELL